MDLTTILPLLSPWQPAEGGEHNPEHCFFPEMQRLSSAFAHLAGTATSTLALADISLLKALHSYAATPPWWCSLLSEAEQQRCAGFSYPKRYLEWLGGRLAAKYCLSLLPAFRTARAKSLSILADEHGRPYLEHGERSSLTRLPQISISHSHGYAAAFCSCQGRCGVDIQKILAKIELVADKFTSPGETSLLRDTDKLLTLTLIWAAKEAIKKSMLHDQPSLFSGIEVQGIRQESERCWTMACSLERSPDGGPVEVRLALLKDYVIACSQEGDHA
ncbi:4'-phosphopantetheinyl transferase family protein [Desulfogranum mediterraneum]|uniref:4'-phosphopantetheinyl transferase family protein n=1 Tax=Desulfogranum mediterraneum TaxID=160661 RepID=UPI00041C4AF3|nr:4'-phosphopantetheinyl transferase family protein [Desulfogranum mediterraneum]